MEKINSKDNLIRMINQYKNLVFSICMKMTGDYFVAEDLTQDTFVLAYMHYEEFDGSNEKAWLCRIASNKCIDYLKSAQRREVAVGEENMPEPVSSEENPLKLYINQTVMEDFKAKCEALPKDYSDIAYMHFISGLTAKEIADRRAIKLKTVQTKIYRAKEMLKKTVRREELLS